ncbi:hypothetical protein [Polaribacter aquimarinus]|uniref:Uncharacterized protein n=1 Tax=Polaribacter aquimarinus TaxID=2100726 RepID=A0A2U2J6S9_9FLAO|nr:hypothetical protein [Polaribacter aquimarinus]PWG04027.1 hypothetical protein DIS07_14910 [Polaribacter aquimarinus]
MTKEYNQNIYKNLNSSTKLIDFNIISLNKDDLGLKFAQFKMTDSLGLTFLHKHFEIDNDEKLICKILNGKSITKPIKTSEIDFEIVPYLWKVEKNENVINWYPVEFVKINNKNDDAYKQYVEFITNNKFQEELGKILVGLNLQDIFGVSTRFRDVLIKNDDDILLEVTDLKNKTLEINPILNSENNPTSDMQTGWFFDVKGNNKMSLSCRNTCRHQGSHH